MKVTNTAAKGTTLGAFLSIKERLMLMSAAAKGHQLGSLGKKLSWAMRFEANPGNRAEFINLAIRCKLPTAVLSIPGQSHC